MKKLTCFMVGMLTFLAHGAVYTVATDETLVVNNANASEFADGIAFADATGVVEFETSSAPTMNITGAGTIKKTYSGPWTMSKQISGFTGDYVLQGGGIVTVSSGTQYYFGAESKTGGSLVIKPNNTLYVPNDGGWAVMGNRPVHISGTGYNSMGAVNTGYAYSTSASFIKYLHLDDDALLHINGPAYYQFFTNAEIDLHGYELTLGGNGDLQLLGSTTVSTNGSIRIRGVSAGKSARLTLRSVSASFSVDSPHADSPFVLDDYAALFFYIDGTSKTKLANRPLWVKGKNASLRTAHQSDVYPPNWVSTNILNWAGPVLFKESGSVLSLCANFPYYQFTVGGQISGDGSVVVKAGSDGNTGRVYLANTNNTYTGYTLVNNSGDSRWQFGSFLAAGPNSIPNYSSLTCNYGFVSAKLKERESPEESLWDVSAITRLANEATWLNYAAVGLDTTYCNGPYTMPWPSEVAADRFIGGSGPGEVVFTNVATTAENRLHLMHGGGVLRVKGTPGRQIHVGEIRVIAPTTNCTESTVLFDGCDLAFDTNSMFNAGFCKVTSSRGDPVPKVTLKDVRFIAGPVTNAWTDKATGAICCAPHVAFGKGPVTDAAIEILDGCAITGRVVVGGRQWDANGAIYQRGGHVTALGNASSVINGTIVGTTLAGSGNCLGYYELSGGELVSRGYFTIGYLNRGYFVQTGGKFVLTNAVGSSTRPQLCVGNGNGYGGSLCIFGGTFDASAGSPSINASNSTDANPFSTISVAGPTAYLDLGANANRPGNSETAVTLFTMCGGGRMRTRGFYKGNTNSTLIVNFNNGTFVPTQNGNGGAQDVFFNYRTYSTYANCQVDHVIVYPGGMTVDTDGKTGVYTYRTLEGATGGGVSGVLSSPIHNIGFAPVVRIDGDGYGAVGVADYDSVSNVLRGVKILAPGVGYTHAIAELYADRVVVAKYNCTIAENLNTGGFTKKGEGSFILYATNTWGGATSVAGGTLTAGCDWAVPPGSDLVLSGGGIMDFNGKTGEVASVTYGAGGGSIANAALVKIPNSASVTISVDELLAGKKVPFEGDVDLDALNVTLTGDLGKLVESDRRYTLIEASGTLSGSINVVTEEPLPDFWSFKIRGSRLQLVFSKGTVMVVK